METRKLKLLIGILGCFMTSNTFAVSLTLADDMSSFHNNYSISGGVIKHSQPHYMKLGLDWNWQHNPIQGSFKTANLNISADSILLSTNFPSESIWFDEISDGLKLKTEAVTKSKYWVVILTKSISMGSATLPQPILTASAAHAQEPLRLCSKGLTLSTFPGRHKMDIKPILNRHSRYLC